MADALDLFSPTARNWFGEAFGSPTDVQEQGWPEISAGHHSLLCAPTGSGKTLAAFFWCLDQLMSQPRPATLERCRVLYVSPLKALAFDVDRNLRSPLRGLALQAARSMPVDLAEISVGVRTGDTPSQDRRDMQRHPPDIMITTPESLFLMLTSAARVVLDSVRWVIVDEIHTMAASKRGAHLAISLERLCRRTGADPQRIGLSATQRPLEEVARYLGGQGRRVRIVNAGHQKTLDLSIEVPVTDMADLDRDSERGNGVARDHSGRVKPDIGITTEVARSRPWASGRYEPNSEPLGTNSGSQVEPSAPYQTALLEAGSVRSGADTARLPVRSIWPAIYPRILELVQSHRSTIIFVNSRRMAERMTAKLNELAEEELVRAHHGSIAREQRMISEELLKSGKLPGLVATSSLELGIDMGAVDLVIQVSSPTSVSRGIQRIGRAGHSVGEPSTGAIFPTHRGDLLECAAVVERMLAGEIETTRVPLNPIDVVAQQVVAMCALDSWDVDDLRAVITRAYPFTELGDRAFNATLDMLDGRYPSQEFGELRPRVVWDRVNGTVRGRSGAQRLAVTSGGTIPDRGLFTVNMLTDGKRVGELDEEMVYELRPGETFVLGATTWKTAEITQSQVRVVPAPGEPGKITFWHGDALGRPVEVGRAVGSLTRELLSLEEAAAHARLMDECRCNETAANNLLAYIKEQEDVTGSAPDDRTIVIERFRDQLGDWRVCVLTPFGSRVHAPWALAIQALLQERYGLEIQSISSDDGFALRLIDAESVPPAGDLLLDPEDVNEAVTSQLHGSALFASRFRENAGRALLLPRARPGSRTPLWLQRQRSADLLRVASKYPDFPIVAETYRECLTDVFDLEALTDLMQKVRSREVRVVEVETASASPFSSSLLFEYIAQYMYEGDTPLAERRAQALTLDRNLLSELLGDDDLRELLNPEVIGQTEIELQGLDPAWWPRDVDEALDRLRTIGDMTAEESTARGIKIAWLEELAQTRRAVSVRIAGEQRWIAADDAGVYRDALGIALPPGLAEVFMEAATHPLENLLTRWANTHVPFITSDPAARWKLAVSTAEDVLQSMVARGDLISGRFRAGRREREYCSVDVLRTLRRRSLAALRKEIEPVSPKLLAQFQPEWQGVGFAGSGLDRLADVIAQLQGYPVPVSVLERDVLASRVSRFTSHMLDELVASGEVVWIGAGALGLTDGRVALYLRKDVSSLAPDRLGPRDADAGDGGGAVDNPPDRVHGAPGENGTAANSEGLSTDGLRAATEDSARLEIHQRLRMRLRVGPCFFTDLVARAGRDESEATLDALWDLVWLGEVTNDTFAPLRFIGPSRRAPRRRSSSFAGARRGAPRSLGRWSLVSDLLRSIPSPTARAHAQCEILLNRYGILTREHAVAESIPCGFLGLYPVLRTMEESGRVRRGYFVEGLGGAQFALAGAVDRLRNRRGDGEGDVVLLAATDPANAYGVSIPWPEMVGRPARFAGAYTVLDSGDLRIFIERGGRSILTRGAIDGTHIAQLCTVAERIGKFEIQNVNGKPVNESALVALFVEAGFAPTPRGLILYPKTGQRSR